MIHRAIRTCDGLIELGWLVTILAIPIYFNTADVRAFEPDKAILLRDLAASLVPLALLRLTLRHLSPAIPAPPHANNVDRAHTAGASPRARPARAWAASEPSPAIQRPNSLSAALRPQPLTAPVGAASAGDVAAPANHSYDSPQPDDHLWSCSCHDPSGSGPRACVHRRSRPDARLAGARGSAPSLSAHLLSPLLARPTLLPLLALAAVTLLACATSLLPAVSWHGSYARAQGGLTTLAYLAFALLLLALLRRPRQFDRLAAAIALAGVGPAAYGWVQHVGRDPLPWQQPDLAARVPGSMGNPIFLGALLVMTIPFALYQLALALRPLLPAATSECTGNAASGAAHKAPIDIGNADTSVSGGDAHRPPERSVSGPTHKRASTHASTRPQSFVAAMRPQSQAGAQSRASTLWSLVLLLQLGALLFTKSRGPFAGLLVALPAFGLGLSYAWRLPRLRHAILALALLAATTLAGANLAGRAALGPIRENSALRLVQWTPSASGTSEVRLEIWGPALQLVAQRPLLGCGPDALLWCYYSVYPTALRHIEAPNAVPDRTHDILLDQAVETGLLGLAALLALLGVTVATLLRLIARAAHPAHRALAAALLAALLGHLAEGSFGIGIVATDLLTWLIAAAAGSLAALEAATTHLTSPAHRPNNLRLRAAHAFDAATPPSPTRHSPAAQSASATTPAVHLRPPASAAPPGAAPAHDSGAPTDPSGSGPCHDTSGSGPNARRHRRAESSPTHRHASTRASTRPQSFVATMRPRSQALAAAAFTLIAAALAWQIVAAGAAAAAADTAARQGADLETVALGNSGQAPVPPGITAQPILALRQFAAAASEQSRAITLEPDTEDYLLNAGTTLVEWAQAATQVGGAAAQQAPTLYVRALEDYGAGARLNPYNPDFLRNTGKAYERWAGLAHDPNKPATWDAGLLARAAQAFARAAALAPRHPDPLTSWAQVALWQGRMSQAQTLLRRALTLDPRDGDAYRLRAGIEISTGKRQPALADWRRALLDPNLNHAGETASQLALAEATWAHARCPAVRDARTALTEPDTPNLATMREILHVDGARCPGW